MFRVLKYVLGASSLLVACLFWLAYLSPRPPLTIDSATLAGDGSQINYCELPIDVLKNGTEVDLSGQTLIVEDVIIIAACIKVSSSMNTLK